MKWIGRLLKKRQLEAELSNELRDHIERQISDYRKAGLTEEAARRKAHLSFGGMEQVREECREARGGHWVESTFQDLRLALRTLGRSPGFTLTGDGNFSVRHRRKHRDFCAARCSAPA